MPIAKVKEVARFTSGDSMGNAAQNLSFTIPAGGVPNGNKVLLFGAGAWNNLPTQVTDARGNPWVIRRDASSADYPLFIVDCDVGTPLVPGDAVTIQRRGPGMFHYLAVEYSGLGAFDTCPTFYDRMTGGPSDPVWTSPALTTAEAGELILGMFFGFRGGSGTLVMTAQAVGYTMESGITNASPDNGVQYIGNGFMWESRIGTAAQSERPIMTANVGPAGNGYGLSAAWKAMPTFNKGVMVV